MCRWHAVVRCRGGLGTGEGGPPRPPPPPGTGLVTHTYILHRTAHPYSLQTPQTPHDTLRLTVWENAHCSSVQPNQEWEQATYIDMTLAVDEALTPMNQYTTPILTLTVYLCLESARFLAKVYNIVWVRVCVRGGGACVCVWVRVWVGACVWGKGTYVNRSDCPVANGQATHRAKIDLETTRDKQTTPWHRCVMYSPTCSIFKRGWPRLSS